MEVGVIVERRERVTVTPEAHRRFVTDVLQATGASSEDSEVVAEGMLWADLRGRHTQGLTRLPNFAERLSKGLIRSPAVMVWKEVSPAAALLDAGHGLGHVASRKAILRAVELARAQGVGLVAVRHSNHFGAAGYYCAIAAEAGCLSFNYTNAISKVAPYGGRKPLLGTNPIGFGCPTSNAGPVLVDLSTSGISGGEVRSTGGKGKSLPPGVALDAEGHPTEDPAKMGCLLPAGGARGFALGLMVEILSGVLTGSAFGKDVGSMLFTWDRPVDVGHLFIAVDIGHFLPLREFMDRLDRLLGWVIATPPLEGFEAVRIPGAIRTELAEKHMREGIPVAQESVAALVQLAQRFNLPIPWNHE